MPSDASKRVWYNDVERQAFVEHHCDKCFQPQQAQLRVQGTGPGCPHLARAEQGKMPGPWTRRRNPALGDTYSCDDELTKPPINRRKNAPADTESMFDVRPADRNLVPVDGWPDYLAEQRKQKDGDHQ